MLKKKKAKEGWVNKGPVPLYSKEILLQYAYANYPLGTTYFCEFNRKKGEVQSSFKFYKKGEGFGENPEGIRLSQNEFITDGRGGCVYFNGKWAKIT